MARPKTPEEKAHLSATLKARGIQPSVKARLKALEANKAKPRVVPNPTRCNSSGCKNLAKCKGFCKPCYDKNRLSNPVISARRKENNKQKIAQDPDYYKRGNIKRYGITLEQYNDAVSSVYGQCEVCENSPHGKGRHGCLHIDHCHDTGKLRGLLCVHCNTGIGMLEHSIEFLENAKAYLIRHGIKEDIIEPGF